MKRRLFKWCLACTIVFFAMLCVLYYMATSPKYSVSDMRKLIAEAHQAIADIPQEQKDLGSKLEEFVKSISQEPESYKGEEAWYREIRDQGGLTRLHETLKHGPVAFGMDDESIDALSMCRMAGDLLKYDLDRALKKQSRREILMVFQSGIRLVESMECKTPLIGFLASMMIRKKMLHSVLSHMHTVSVDILETLVTVLKDSEKRLPKAADLFGIELARVTERSLVDPFLAEQMRGFWMYHLDRVKVKAISLMMDYHFKCLEAMQGPPSEAIPRLQEINNSMDERTGPRLSNYLSLQSYLHALAALVVYPYREIYSRLIRLHADYRGVRIALALELHRRTTGTYPADLKALVPAVLPALPDDPFSRRPFCYAKKGKDYLLYSVGANLIDDGGVYKVTVFDEGRFLPYGAGEVVIVRPSE